MAFPNTSIFDNFNRANGALGANWANSAFMASGGLTIVTNQVGTGGTSNNGSLYTAGGSVGPLTGRPFELYATWPTRGGNSDFGLDYCVAANSSPESLYRLQQHASTSLNLYRAVSGSYTQIFTIAQTIASGDAFGVSLDTSGVHTIWYKAAAGAWTSLGTATDSTRTSGLYGACILDTTQKMDDIGGGVVPAASSAHTLTLLGVGS